MDNWHRYREETPPNNMGRTFFDQRFSDQIIQMSQTPQDKIFHAEGDVWTHTQMVVNEIEQHPRFVTGTLMDQNILMWAALLHDISKPQTTRENGGRITAPNHSKKGAIWARKNLWELGFPPYMREQIAGLILYHQIPFFALSEEGKRGEFLTRKLSCDVDLSLLCALAESDVLGRVCPDQQNILDQIDLFRLLAKDLDCYEKPYDFPNKTTRSSYVRSYGSIDPNTPVWDKDMFTVYMTSGLPASGKDTWAETQNIPIVSYDAMRKTLGKKHGKDNKMIAHAVEEEAKKMLRQKQSFIWNATFLTTSMRAPVCDLIRKYGGRVCFVCVEGDKNDILNRNNTRDTTLKNQKLLDMAQMWEVPLSWEGDENMLIVNPRPKKQFKHI